MVRLKDIARRARVSVSAVSLALRNHPRIGATTRERIQLLARKMGYTANPLVTALMVNVRRRQRLAFHGTIGWINDYPHGNDPFARFDYREVHRGAVARAGELGYTIDVIGLPGVVPDDDDGNQRRFQRILLARGIHGVIFPTLYWARLLAHDWAPFSIATLGDTEGFLEKRAKPGFEHLVYPHVQQDLYADTFTALGKLGHLGYPRVGLVTTRHHDTAASFRISSALFAFSRAFPERPLLPVCEIVGDISEEPPASFRSWLCENKPDAVVTTIGLTRAWLEHCGRPAPRSCGLAHPFLSETEPGWSGVREDHALTGTKLVDLVIGQIYRNERGMSPQPTKLILTGNWEYGETTRRRPRAAGGP